ncbi:MAG: phosphatase [Flavobacteriales bacterium]|nr:MAG: phosphatase [Flavobacteriales bacterium]
MQVAIIDCGTNTFNLFIAEVKNSSYRTIFKTKIPVKLGEGAIDRNLIAEVPFQRGIEALKTHKITIEKYKTEKIFAFATSAIRSAKNGLEFVKVAKKETGIDINVIDGNREAELIYYGVKQALYMGKEKSLIMDIGGGSTEFIIANNKEIFWKKSFQLGVSRLLEKFKPNEPITKKEIEKVENYLEKEIQPLLTAIKKHSTQSLVGASGSFDSIAEMVAHRFYKLQLLKGRTTFEFKINEMKAVHDALIKSTYEERLRMKGLVKYRADMIVLSSIFVNLVIEKLKIKRMRLSIFALKEGVLWEIMNS